jgi:MFS transporter, OFA family, oxalate/formate antiporter
MPVSYLQNSKNCDTLFSMNKSPNPGSKKKTIFYGWIVVACVFVILFVMFGSAYSFSTFFESLQAEFDASRSSISFVFAIAGFIYFSLGAISGQIADRFGSRRVIIFGLIVVSISFFLASRVETIWQIYAVYGLGIGIGIGFAYAPAISVVQRWFVKRRGLASGLAVTGIGLGTLGMPVFSAALIHWSDWRNAYLVISILIFICGVSAAIFIPESPQRCGLLPDGDDINANAINASQETDKPKAAVIREISLKDALHTKPFWFLYAGSFSFGLGLFIPFVHLIPFSNDLGLPNATGVMLFSLIGVGSTVGRFLLGSIADRIGRRLSLVMMYAGAAAIFAWWLAAANVWQLAIFALIYGACYGGYVAIMPAVAADYFSGPNISGVIGTLITSVAVGNLIGPPIAGFIFDLFHSYTIPIFASIITSLFAAGCAFVLEEPDKWRESFLRSTA